jgi:glycosyltransferase involved in cell wall biosynthesis
MVNNYQVLHLSTGHDGGAGISARRLNTALVNAGINSQFLALKNKGYTPKINESSINRNLIQKILSATIAKLQSKISSKFFFSIYSLNVLSVRKIKRYSQSEKTILHIHNWFNLLNQKQIAKFQKLGYLVVVTLHDERFYTGGCHHAFYCNGYMNNCSACPQIYAPLKFAPAKNLIQSIKAFKSETKSLFLIAPSTWILNRAKDSTLLKKNQIYFISNTHTDFTINKTINRKVNLNNPTVIGVASKDPNSNIKGADIIKSIQKLIIEENLDYKIIFLSSHVDRNNQIESFWESIDLLLVPSRADNSPNVIHEAKSLGIPVVASTVGGITELLDPEFDELIPFEQLTAAFILHKLDLRKRSKKEFSVMKMQEKFHAYSNNSVNQHIQLYNQLIAENS